MCWFGVIAALVYGCLADCVDFGFCVVIGGCIVLITCLCCLDFVGFAVLVWWV